jgi:hypothetical protein
VRRYAHWLANWEHVEGHNRRRVASPKHARDSYWLRLNEFSDELPEERGRRLGMRWPELPAGVESGYRCGRWLGARVLLWGGWRCVLKAVVWPAVCGCW